MSTETVFVIIRVVVAVAGLVWWAYQRGQAAATHRAEDRARIEALERQLTQTGKELAALQSRRGRA
jgi:Tfp pilus assembly protein PilO